MRPATENKMLRPDALALENKATAAEPVKYRVPTGQLDAQVFARLLDGGTHGAVTLLDVRTWRHSPAEVSNDPEAFHPTAGGVKVQVQFPPALLEAGDGDRQPGDAGVRRNQGGTSSEWWRVSR